MFRLCSCIARLLYFEGISYGFCDAYCRGHTGSRPERAVGSLLASLSGKVPGTARDCDLSCLPSIQNTLNHLGLVPGSLGNRWKKALGSWLGLLPQHVTGMSSILRCSRSYFNRFSLFAHRLYRQVPCQTPQSHELCNPYGFSHAQVSNRPLPILPFTAILNVDVKEQPDERHVNQIPSLLCATGYHGNLLCPDITVDPFLVKPCKVTHAWKLVPL